MRFFVGVLMWAIAVLCLSALPSSAQTVSESEAREFQRIIVAQIEAFRAYDGAAGSHQHHHADADHRLGHPE